MIQKPTRRDFFHLAGGLLALLGLGAGASGCVAAAQQKASIVPEDPTTTIPPELGPTPSESELVSYPPGFLVSSRFQKGGDLYYLVGNGNHLDVGCQNSPYLMAPLNDIFDLRSVEVFNDFPAQRFFEHVGDKKTVNVLYPGSDDHLAPLQVSYVLHSINPGLREVVFNYTEVYPNYLKLLASQLVTLQAVGVITNLEDQDISPADKLSFDEVTDDYDYRQRPQGLSLSFDLLGEQPCHTVVNFKVNMHDGDSWFTAEDACAADLVINHSNPYYCIEDVVVQTRKEHCPSKPFVMMGSPTGYKPGSIEIEDLVARYSSDHLLLPGKYAYLEGPAVVHFLK